MVAVSGLLGGAVVVVLLSMGGLPLLPHPPVVPGQLGPVQMSQTDFLPSAQEETRRTSLTVELWGAQGWSGCH